MALMKAPLPPATWHGDIETVSPHVVRITTPDVAGTGFMVYRGKAKIGVMTAAHVVRDAHAWNQTITIHHEAFPDGSVEIGPEKRQLLLHHSKDSAFMVVPLPDGIGDALPKKPIELLPIEKAVKSGVEVGWLGYPYLAPGTLCFFAGRVSAFDGNQYLVDGIAIGGVSGGPAFYNTGTERGPVILGSITAYRPARRGSEVLPGLMVVDEVGWARIS